jgi:MFS transporter, Spinster family, sphingosine-1-phosphate transporter
MLVEPHNIRAGPMIETSQKDALINTRTSDRRGLALYAMAVLFLAQIAGNLDRQILGLLVQPVKASLALTDGQIGLMQGTAFILTFCFAGLFIGNLVDRYNRRNILILCIAIWSLSTAAGGLAQNGWQLFLARMGVGVGEAALFPASFSLIADYFSAERRGRAIGFFITGSHVGGGLSLILVAFALPSLNELALHPGTGAMAIEPWRLVMFSMLLPGLLCCLFLAGVREPLRSIDPSSDIASKTTGFQSWWSRANLFIPHHFGFAFASFSLFALIAWVPTILIREYGFNPSQAGLKLGTIFVIVGCSAAYLAGWVGDEITRRKGPAGRLSIVLYCIPVAVLGFLLIGLPHSPAYVFLGAICIMGGIGATLSIGLASLSDFSKPESRGQISAIYLLIYGLVGSGSGAAAVGYANDLVGGETCPLSVVLCGVGIVACVLAFLLIALAIVRAVQEDAMALDGQLQNQK